MHSYRQLGQLSYERAVKEAKRQKKKKGKQEDMPPEWEKFSPKPHLNDRNKYFIHTHTHTHTHFP